ncbi:FAD-dependent oxidoreductase [Spirulina major]|uniref:FAD-dependent oxidoreductase n=1 Tax=Spirulina major TaxID=270636 RepID=UPI000935086C|nr:FAD-dependent oxidoreductase [Spirulina major]
MAFDYDLVIVGHTPAGVAAALEATQQGARVALVNHNLPPAIAPYIRYGLRYWSSQQRTEWAAVDWPAITAQIQGGVAAITEQWSPAVLGMAGVDWVAGMAEFVTEPALGLQVGERVLRSRAYLLALETTTARPELAGLNVLTVDQLLTLPQLPAQLAIVGHQLDAVELAQSLQRLGSQITLICRDRLLPHEDPSLVQRIQAILDGSGVTVLPHSPIQQLKVLDGQTWLQLPEQALATDALLWLDRPQPEQSGLHLDRVQVTVHPHGIPVTATLQTHHPRIYGIGAGLGGYDLPHLAQAEATQAVHHALKRHRRAMDYRTIPIILHTDPAFARVGLTVVQARAHYGEAVLCHQTYIKDSASAALRGTTTGLCRVVVLPSGELLGAAVLGSAASEAIAVFALALAQRLTLDDLPSHLFPQPSFSEAIAELLTRWHQHHPVPRWRQWWPF